MALDSNGGSGSRASRVSANTRPRASASGTRSAPSGATSVRIFASASVELSIAFGLYSAPSGVALDIAVPDGEVCPAGYVLGFSPARRAQPLLGTRGPAQPSRRTSQ